MNEAFCNSSYMGQPTFYTVTQTSWLKEVRELNAEYGIFFASVPVGEPQWKTNTWAKLAAVVLLVLVATIGNILVILSVIFNKAMRTTINFYLVNLTVADLMVTAWGPFHSLMKELSRKTDGADGEYFLPAIFCKLNSFYTVVCVVSSVLTLSAISCDRFMAVFCPLQTRVTQRKARYFIVFVWTLAVAVASPFLAVSTIFEFKYSPLNYSSSSCHETFPTFPTCDLTSNTVVKLHVAKKIYYSLVNIVMFLLPGLLMTLCYSLIVAKLYCSAAPGERTGVQAPQALAKKKVLKLVLVVIATFFLCWSPQQLLMAHAIFSTDHQLTRNTFWIHMFAYSHAMINPIIYITFNENFKKAFKRFFFCSTEEISWEHSTSMQRQFSWKLTFSCRGNSDHSKNIEIRCAAPSRGSSLYSRDTVLSQTPPRRSKTWEAETTFDGSSDIRTTLIQKDPMSNV